jgi:RNA polymerase sigma-70 factor (ECF subfamily)
MAYDDVRQLYDRHSSALLGYASAITGERAAAEDVVHQVFLKMMKGNLLPSEPAAYLFRAVRNAALNARRNGMRHVQLDREQAWFEASGDKETGMALQAALLQIPAEQREVVVLRVWCEMTLAEIGEILEASPNTVASRYRYGLSKLRELMRPYEAKNGRP